MSVQRKSCHITDLPDVTPSEKGLILFGPSGSGKSWLAQRLFKAILLRLRAEFTGSTYTIRVSAYEFGLTATNVLDLCDQKSLGVPTSKTLGGTNKTTLEVTIKTEPQIDQLWVKIQSLRSTSPTSNNAASSRKHAVYQLVSRLVQCPSRLFLSFPFLPSLSFYDLADIGSNP